MLKLLLSEEAVQMCVQRVCMYKLNMLKNV